MMVLMGKNIMNRTEFNKISKCFNLSYSCFKNNNLII